MITHEDTRAAWDALAPGYDELITVRNMTPAEDALHRVGLQPGMRLLDVAAGCGALSIPAARAGAHVVATDISPAMIERLGARAHAEGLLDLEARVMDGHALDLEDDSFDIAASQFGVMLFPDLPRGLSEMVRVTKPGGRVLVVAFGPPPTLEFLTFFIGALQASIPGFTGFPADPPPLPFQAAHPNVLLQRMSEAGLRDVRIETTNFEMEGPDSGQYLWDAVTFSNPIGAALVADLSEDQTTAAQKAFDAMLRERSGGSGRAVLNNQVNIGIGTK